jgi:NAD(P) transhydrogenase subunit alpha
VIIGAIFAATQQISPHSRIFGSIAVLLASVNIFGGFAVTRRMLNMFHKK